MHAGLLAGKAMLDATDFSTERPVIEHTPLGESIHRQILHIYDARGNEFEHAVEMTGRLYTMLALFMHGATTNTTQNSANSYVQKGIEYISSNYSYHITVEDISAYVGLSRSQLFRSFESVLGQSPKEYLTDFRMIFTEHGFPPELIAELEKRCGKRVIGNKSASGTEIIEELGEEEINTGAMIVYTSADSVLQICGNEETFDLQNLYRCCEIAREITLKDEWRVGRVIARPYVGKKKGEFKRTSNRHDYALKPTGPTVLNAMKDKGLDVIGVGKINDIFCGEGITETYHSTSSVNGMEQTIEISKKDFHGLCFVNLVDFLGDSFRKFLVGGCKCLLLFGVFKCGPLMLTADERVIEAGNEFRGKRIGHGEGALWKNGIYFIFIAFHLRWF